MNFLCKIGIHDYEVILKQKGYSNIGDVPFGVCNRDLKICRRCEKISNTITSKFGFVSRFNSIEWKPSDEKHILKFKRKNKIKKLKRYGKKKK